MTDHIAERVAQITASMAPEGLLVLTVPDTLRYDEMTEIIKAIKAVGREAILVNPRFEVKSLGEWLEGLPSHVLDEVDVAVAHVRARQAQRRPHA